MKQETNFYLITFLKALFLTIATFLTPIKGLLIITGMAVFLDTIFAIYTTIKLNGWASYQSSKFKIRTISRIVSDRLVLY